MTTVRQFHTGDVDDLVDMWRRAAPRDPVTTERFRNLVLLDANFDPAGLRVAVDGDQLVGCAYAVRRKVAMVGDDLEPHLGWIPFFYVDPSARRRGVGSTLLGHLIDAARCSGWTRLSLETGSWPYFAAAQALYRRHGFIDSPPFGDYRADPNSVFLTLALDAPNASSA